MITEYFSFELGATFQAALPLNVAVEVLKLTPDRICPIPGVDPSLLGVINWRGQLLWSANLGQFLGLKLSLKSNLPVSTLNALVITHTETQRKLACVVSELKGILEIAQGQIHPVPSQIPAPVRSYFSGVATLPTSLFLLNPAAILNSPRWQGQS